MTLAVIIDLIAAAILLGFILAGAGRGLFRTLAGLLIIVLAMTGARFAAARGTPYAVNLLTPVVERRIQRELDKTLPEAGDLLPGQMPEDPAAAAEIEELLGILGIRDSRLEDLAERARTEIRDSGVSVLTAAAMSAAESLLYGLLYILAFFLVLTALRLAARAMDLMMRLPVLHTANALCGALAGALEGVLVLLVLCLALRALGVSLEGTYLGRMIILTRLL